MEVLTQYLKANGYSQLTGISVSTGFTVVEGTKLALCQAEAQQVRWRDDGTAPTATVGMILQPGDTLIYDAADMVNLKFIQVVAGAIVNVSQYK